MKLEALRAILAEMDRDAEVYIEHEWLYVDYGRGMAIVFRLPTPPLVSVLPTREEVQEMKELARKDIQREAAKQDFEVGSTWRFRDNTDYTVTVTGKTVDITGMGRRDIMYKYSGNDIVYNLTPEVFLRDFERV